MSISADPNVGSELLGYRLEELIGRGGMGVVFRARDQRLERNVALKLLAPELAVDQRFHARFLRESVLLASLDHPNVIPIYDAGEADGRLFIAMRYVEGGDLHDLLRAGPLEPELALDLCSQIAEALDAAHERGLVHRDVKPSNVLLDERRHVYLADFGLTRQIAGGDAPALEARSLGTIDYIAPEQIRGEEIDGRADLYSLGCLLYECLTGEPPFRRPSDLAVAFAHLEEEPPASSDLEDLMRKALAKDPEDRYQSGHELVSDARAALGLDAPHRRRWPIAVAAVVLALVAAGSLASLLTQGRSTGAALNGRLLRIDPNTNRVRSVDVGSDPSSVAFGAKRVWVSTQRDSKIWAIDPHTLKATPFAANGRPLGVAVSRGFVYVPEVAESGGDVTVLKASNGHEIAPIPTGLADYFGGPIASSGGGVWFAEELVNRGRALRLEPTSRPAGTFARTAHVPILDPRPANEAHVRFDFAGVAAGRHAVWVAGDALDRRVFRIYPHTNRVVPISLGFPPGGIAAGPAGVWVTDQLGHVVARIDPAANKIERSVRVDSEPTGVAEGGGFVWVANTGDRSISRIDPHTNHVKRIPLNVSPKAVTWADGAVWVAASAA